MDILEQKWSFELHIWHAEELLAPGDPAPKFVETHCFEKRTLTCFSTIEVHSLVCCMSHRKARFRNFDYVAFCLVLL